MRFGTIWLEKGKSWPFLDFGYEVNSTPSCRHLDGHMPINQILVHDFIFQLIKTKSCHKPIFNISMYANLDVNSSKNIILALLKT